jgi:hypothetical protein
MYADSELLRQQRAFLFEVEQAIRAANREIIHTRLPTIDRNAVYTLAVTVAQFRAAYLEAAFKLNASGGNDPEPALIADLKAKRETFEEARSAFAALQRAIEVGYVDVNQVKGG